MRYSLTVLHVSNEVLFQGIPADVRVAVIEVTVTFPAVLAAELVPLPA